MIERARRGDSLAREQISDLLRDRVVRTAGHYASLTGMDREDLQQEMWLGMMLGLHRNMVLSRVIERARRGDSLAREQISDLLLALAARPLV